MAMHPWMRIMSLLGALAWAAGPLYAGSLRLGTPEVRDNQYTFPVYLQGNAVDVAALDFRLAYDPAVFSPVSANSGRSAVQAQKQVSSNVAAPGEFVVVMMGFNQNAVQPGEVIAVVLEKIGEPAGGQSILQINEPTMATIDGMEIDSNGGARTVRFDQEKDGDDDSDPEEERPNSPDNGDATDDETPMSPDESTASPRFPITVASLEPETGGGRPDSESVGDSGSGPAVAGTPASPDSGTPTSADGHTALSGETPPLPGPLADAERRGAANGTEPSGIFPVPGTTASLSVEGGQMEIPAAALESGSKPGLVENQENSGSSPAVFGILASFVVGLTAIVVLTRRPRRHPNS